MSEGNTTVAVTETVVQTNRGERGELGVATASLTIKQRWLASKTGTSLKAYARNLAKSGDANAKEWLGNKAGAKNQKRSSANATAAKAAAAATKLGRKKSKSGGKAKATTEASA